MPVLAGAPTTGRRRGVGRALEPKVFRRPKGLSWRGPGRCRMAMSCLSPTKRSRHWQIRQAGRAKLSGIARVGDTISLDCKAGSYVLA